MIEIGESIVAAAVVRALVHRRFRWREHSAA